MFRHLSTLFDNQESLWCDVSINVKHLSYGISQEYYDITYHYAYSRNIKPFIVNVDDNVDELHRKNPFYYKKNIISSDMLDGVIIAKNSMTDEMVKYLLVGI